MSREKCRFGRLHHVVRVQFIISRMRRFDLGGAVFYSSEVRYDETLSGDRPPRDLGPRRSPLSGEAFCRTMEPWSQRKRAADEGGRTGVADRRADRTLHRVHGEPLGGGRRTGESDRSLTGRRDNRSVGHHEPPIEAISRPGILWWMAVTVLRVSTLATLGTSSLSWGKCDD